MTLHEVLFRADGLLRAPWRIAAFLTAAVLAGLVVGSIGIPLLEGAGADRQASYSVAMVATLLVAHAVVLRYLDRRPWADVWMGRDAARPGAWGHGFAVGTLAIGAPVALLLALGWMERVDGPAGSSLVAALRVSTLLLPAALAEELLFRGYLMSVLREAWGVTAAVVVTSILFGLVHVQNVAPTPLAITLVALAGVWLAVVVLATRSLYAAWMAHFAWNYTMAALFHTPVSGMLLEAPDYRVLDAGPDWATGGAWGPEGGVLGGLGMLGGLTYMIARLRRRGER